VFILSNVVYSTNFQRYLKKLLIFSGLLAVVDYVYFSPHLKNSPTLNKKIHRMVCLIANCARHHKTIRSASETKATERYFLKNYIKTILKLTNI